MAPLCFETLLLLPANSRGPDNGRIARPGPPTFFFIMPARPAAAPRSYHSSLHLPQRQVHLDFHTSSYISDVGKEFDAEHFVETFKRAHVNSVTVFARCHHGMCYFPSKIGTPHPALCGRDLLGEMIEALHRADIRAPIYTTVAWDEDVAQRFPSWRQTRADGTFARVGNADPTKPRQPGGWHFNDWIHPDYQNYLEAHVREIAERYEVDGLFFDILFYEPHAHYSDASMELRRKHALTGRDEATFRRFETLAQERFCSRFTRLVRTVAPGATIFYNSIFDPMIDASLGARRRSRHMTHFELESLPSGFWGYYHFPRAARSARLWKANWLGMTGRFQTMWGDFGGIKPQAALEYECFRAQALGGGNSVGDQLPPRGTLDAAAYDLIGAVYQQCASAEAFYANSTALPHIGVLTANHPAHDLNESAKSDEGAIQMCEESHYEAALLDDSDALDPYALLILPDCTTVTPKLAEKLKKFNWSGGCLVLSHHAGRDANGKWALDFLPLTFADDVDKFPTYWRAKKQFWPEFSASDRVIYSQGTQVVAGRSTRVLVDRILPYFKRSDLHFSSHFQTPPIARADRYPAVVAGERFVYFADPIFREYREVGNIAARDVWRRVMEELIGAPPYGAGLPTTVLSYPRRRQRQLLLTLLHYVPLRKALQLDVLEERMSFAGEALHLPSNAQEVRVHGTGERLPRNEAGAFILPVAKGRLLLEVPNFFRASKHPIRSRAHPASLGV
jgi:hypothetical protein